MSESPAQRTIRNQAKRIRNLLAHVQQQVAKIEKLEIRLGKAKVSLEGYETCFGCAVCGESCGGGEAVQAALAELDDS